MLFHGIDIEVTKRKNCKHFILRAPADGRPLQLSTPIRATKAQVNSFLQEHEDWIVQHASHQPTWSPRYLPGEKHWHLGKQVTLGIGGVPNGKNEFLLWQKEQLVQLTLRMTQEWARRLQVSPKQIKFRSMKSKWGSCNVKTGVITLNTLLVAMPIECVEYVVVHELCHLIHPDHSPNFHQAMSGFLPDWKERKKVLNSFLRTAHPSP